MAQLAAQAKQGPPGPAGIDGKPGMTGIPVSVTCDSFEYFNEFFLCVMKNRDRKDCPDPLDRRVRTAKKAIEGIRDPRVVRV